MSPARIQHFLLLGQADPAGFASREMLAYFNDLGHRKALADGVERERIVGNVLVTLAGRAHQVLYPEARLESIRNRAAVAHFAEDDVAMQLHLYVLAAADPPGKGHAQTGAGNVQHCAIERLRWSRKDLDLRRILGLIARFTSPFCHLWLVRVGRGHLWRGDFRDVRNGVRAST